MMCQEVDDTRHRLLEAAGEIFAEKGFSAATVREICERAGANIAAVNYHFRDKEHVYIEVIRHAHHGGVENLPPEWKPGTPPAVKLREYIRHMLTRILEDERPVWHAQLILREMTEPTQACVALVKSYLRPRYDRLDEIITELVSAETSATDRHLIAFSIVGQCLHSKVLKPIGPLLVGEAEYRTYDVARLAYHVAQCSLAALGHGKSVWARLSH